jgi:hypothetical protein
MAMGNVETGQFRGDIMPSIFDEIPAFLELGAWTTRHIRPLFDLFRDEDVAPALALIIFGSALMLCFLFLVDSSFIRVQVRRRIRAVKSIKDRVEFAEAMPNIEKLMLGTRYLRHSWQKFRETLIEPSEDEGRGPKVVLNTARPQDYFNTAEAGLRFPLYRAMPNLLVGIGLLLTFCHHSTAQRFPLKPMLRNSLTEISQGLRSADISPVAFFANMTID